MGVALRHTASMVDSENEPPLLVVLCLRVMSVFIFAVNNRLTAGSESSTVFLPTDRLCLEPINRRAN